MKHQKGTWCYIVFLFGFAFFSYFVFGYTVNLTNSLPYKFFILNKIASPSVGGYISFKAPPESGYSDTTIMTKKVAGGPGDTVERKNDDFYINKKWVCRAKKYSLEGEPLALGPEGRLKKGQYYVIGQNPYSLDSRYQKIGWVNERQIVAVAYPIF